MRASASGVVALDLSVLADGDGVVGDIVAPGKLAYQDSVAAIGNGCAAHDGGLFEGPVDGTQGVDLSAVAVLAPQIVQAPTLQANNMLHVKGFFPGQPVQINFELLFVPTAGQWRLFGLAAAAVPSNGAVAPKAVAPVQKDAPKKPAPPKTP